MNFLFYTMIFATVVVTYIFWVRPILKKTPALSDFFKKEDTVFGAFSAKFDGIKQRLLHAFIGMAGLVVVMYDSIAPKITGIDVTPLTTMLSHYIPDWGWPLIMIAAVSVLDWFRSLADKEMAAKIAAAAPAPAAPEPPAAPGV